MQAHQSVTAIAFVLIRESVMRDAVFKNSGLPLSIEEIEDPVRSPTYMFITVCACGICGTDLHWSEINNEDSDFVISILVP